MHIHNIGKRAEIFTMLYYMLSMHWPLKWRYKTKLGEIDLIFKRGKTIVFTEVKARKIGMHENIVTFNQQGRIRRCAQIFIMQNKKYQNYDLRFDLSVVAPKSWPLIIKNAW